MLFRRTHIHLEAGRAASFDSDTALPTALSHSLLQSLTDLFAQCSSLLILPISQKLVLPSHCMPCLGQVPLSWQALPQKAQWVYSPRTSYAEPTISICVWVSAIYARYITFSSVG